MAVSRVMIRDVARHLWISDFMKIIVSYDTIMSAWIPDLSGKTPYAPSGDLEKNILDWIKILS
jgi:hypothetical protein